MKHVSLDTEEEAVKRFIITLAMKTETSVLELGGREVARFLPTTPRTNGTAPADEEWTDAKNARRSNLIDKKIAGALSPDEAIELCDLQREMLRHRDRVAPLPLDYARQLHQDLLKRAKASPSGANQ